MKTDEVDYAVKWLWPYHSLQRKPHILKTDSEQGAITNGLQHVPKTHTESCPGKTCGASLRAPGLVGEITEMEGLSIFWDSKELEPKMRKKNQVLFSNIFVTYVWRIHIFHEMLNASVTGIKP